jgi:hypothetical protein
MRHLSCHYDAYARWLSWPARRCAYPALLTPHRIGPMPTSDADRYAQLRQNLAVGLDAIREAIEMAFGVTLPTASTLNAEFEMITSAIYAAADQPRPVPVIDDKPTTRTHFVYRIDIWTDDAKNILVHLAGMENLIVARAAYRAACGRWPNARITLRQGARVVEDSRGRTRG